MSAGNLLTQNYAGPDTMPGYEEDHQGPTTEQTGSLHELVSMFYPGETGALGFLFDSSWVQTMNDSAATPLEDPYEPDVPGVDVELANRMTEAAEVTSTHVYQPNPSQAPQLSAAWAAASASGPQVEPASPGAWSFTDTLRSEATKAANALAALFGKANG